MAELILRWLATYAVHSTVLILGVFLLERARLLVERDVREWAWRVALFGGLATAALQVAASRDGETLIRSLASAATSTTEELLPVVADESPAHEPALVAAPHSARVDESGTALLDGRVASMDAGARRGEIAPVVAESDAVEAPAELPRLPPTIVLPRTVSALIPVAAWLALAASGCLLLILQFRALRRRYGASARVPDAEVVAEVSRLARDAGVVVAELRCTEHVASPLVLPPATLCLPAWALDQLDATQRRAMLAHEIAHLARRDPWWRLAETLLSRLMFFQPLNRLARRRLEHLAELACDDWAARRADARALAQCLAACGERIVFGTPVLASAMAGSRAALVHRIRTLLEESPMRIPVRVFLARSALVVAVLGVLALPVVVFEGNARASNHIHVQSSDSLFGKSMQVSVDKGQGRLKARFDGDFEINENEDDLTSVGKLGWIEQTLGGVKRRVDFEHDGGKLVRRFQVDGEDQPFEPAGRQFLAQVIPTLLRETAIDAEARVGRLERKGGKEAVVAEIEQLGGDYARRVYVSLLSARGALEPAQVDRLIASVARSKSSYEQRESYSALIENQTLAAGQQAAILGAVAAMESDYEKRTVLTALAPKLVLDDLVVAGWTKALGTIDSSYEVRESISALAERDDLPVPLVEASIKAVERVDSDYEVRTALAALARHVSKSPGLAVAYAKSLEHVQSDYDQREAVSALVENATLDAAGYHALLALAERIDSDYDCRTALQSIASRMPGDDSLIRQYRQVARKLGDYDRGQAEKALDRFVVL